MAYWLSRLKALAAMEPVEVSRMLAYSGLILAGSKRHKGMRSLAMDLAVYAKIFFLFFFSITPSSEFFFIFGAQNR